MSPLPAVVLALIAAPDLIHDRTPLETLRNNVAHGGIAVPGELVVTLRSLDHQTFVFHRALELGCKETRRFGDRPIYLVSCSRSRALEHTVAGFEKIDGVRWVDASYREREEAAPNDLDVLQWYHQNTGQRIDGLDGVEGADLASLDAWDLSTGDPNLVIMISDVGLYPEHVDLAEQIWVNADEDCGNGVDDDGNGYVDDCRGWDFADDDNDPSPTSLPDLREDGTDCPNWHATMIAGLAGARGDNGAGVVGVNWRVSLMNVKKHRDVSCESTTSRSIESIYYAIDNGADVIGMSFSSSNFDASFEAALQEAERAGLLMVSSGGNGGTDDDLESRYPNQYDVQASIVVANSTNQDVLHASSNWGAVTVDMAAPGTEVVSTVIDGPDLYGIGTGASFSAGFAAGAAALVWAAFPDLTNLEVTRALEEGVHPLDSMDCARTSRCVRSGGRIDLFGAFARASEIAPANVMAGAQVVESSGDGKLERGEEAKLSVTLMNLGRSTAYGLTVRIADAGGLEIVTGEATIGNVPTGESVELQDSLRVQVPSGCTPFDATVTLAFSDRFGAAWDQQVGARVECAVPAEMPEMPEPEKPDEERPDPNQPYDDGAGCTATDIGGDTWSLGILFLGLAILASRRRFR